MNLLNRSRIGRAIILLVLLGAFCIPATQMQAKDLSAEASAFEITFEELGYEEQVLQDPYSAVRYYFSLPINWKPNSPTFVELHLNYTFAGGDVLPPGLLVVNLNYDELMSTHFLPSGEFTQEIELPTELLYAPETGLANMLELQFISYIDCNLDQDLEAYLTVRNSSLLHIGYEIAMPVLNLGAFPQPLYFTQALIPDQAMFVLPDDPNTNELEAALSITSRIGESTRDKLPLSVTSAGELNPENAVDAHLIVIGTPETNSLINQLELPVSVQERELELRSAIPTVVFPDQAFNVQITAKNTSESPQALEILDRLPAGVQMECADCVQLDSGLYRWELGTLDPGQEVTIEFQVTVDSGIILPDSLFEHTASLVNTDGAVLNVDSLSTTVDSEGNLEEASQVVESTVEKSAYFFTQDDEAVAEEAGIIQEIISPWNPGKVVVVVTGLSDETVYKAGLALGTRDQFLGMNGPVAIVQSALPSDDVSEMSAEMITFRSLGYQNVRATYFEEVLQVNFDIPPGWLINDGMTLELHHAYSEALNSFFSNLEIGTNGFPVKTILYGDQETSESIWTTVKIPTNLLQAGTNVLTFRLIGDYPICLSYRVAQSFWSTIFSDSYLYLPHTVVPIDFDLDQYPYPFTLKPDLSDLLFALPAKMSMEQFQEIVHLASSLGYSAKGAQFFPQVVQGEVAPETYADHNIIVYGRPLESAVISTLNHLLPQPFIPGTDVIQQSVDNIIYQIPQNYDLGFIQLLPSPRSSEKAVLVLTGSTDSGVNWSVNALLDDQLNYKLEGNLAVLATENVIRTTNTLKVKEDILEGLIPTETPETTQPPESTPAPTATPMPEIEATPTPTSTSTPVKTVSASQVSAQRPSLLWYLLGLSLVIIVATLYLVIRKRK
jgi:hypothetical protein